MGAEGLHPTNILETRPQFLGLQNKGRMAIAKYMPASAIFKTFLRPCETRYYFVKCSLELRHLRAQGLEVLTFHISKRENFVFVKNLLFIIHVDKVSKTSSNLICFI